VQIGNGNGNSSNNRGLAAAYTITEECERLFCGILCAVFLGEGDQRRESLVVGMRFEEEEDDDRGVSEGKVVIVGSERRRMSVYDGGLGTPPPDLGVQDNPRVTQWIEVWDYTGGTRFRGFVAETETKTSRSESKNRTLFVFFDEMVVGKDLKQGYVGSSFFSSFRVLWTGSFGSDFQLSNTMPPTDSWPSSSSLPSPHSPALNSSSVSTESLRRRLRR